MPNVGLPELMLLAIVALLVFGPKKIPEIANALGRSIQEFRKGSRELEDTVRRELTAAEPSRVVDGAPDGPAKS
ncbi:MAG: twin-arginine translocase TatA/TatE family subunit [Candidatus Sericytochromatia bacterium]|nr:twin-arginine translocase TatA/TatE family subunit [Candidatus Sericytochromatia bacterium]